MSETLGTLSVYTFWRCYPRSNECWHLVYTKENCFPNDFTWKNKILLVNKHWYISSKEDHPLCLTKMNEALALFLNSVSLKLTYVVTVGEPIRTCIHNYCVLCHIWGVCLLLGFVELQNAKLQTKGVRWRGRSPRNASLSCYRLLLTEMCPISWEHQTQECVN